MIKIEKVGKTDGILEMRGTVDELTAETVLIMQTLAQQLEAQSDLPAADHIAALAQIATDDRLIDTYNQVMHKYPGVDLGSVLWKWGNGDEP